MLSSNTQVNTLSYIAVQQATTGSQSFVPVNASQYMYAHFQHVSGVPTSEGGVSISKLQILNSLIDSMIQKNKAKAEDGDITDEQILQTQTMVLAQENLAQEIPYLLTGITAGRIFSLQV